MHRPRPSSGCRRASPGDSGPLARSASSSIASRGASSPVRGSSVSSQCSGCDGQCPPPRSVPRRRAGPGDAGQLAQRQRGRLRALPASSARCQETSTRSDRRAQVSVASSSRSSLRRLGAHRQRTSAVRSRSAAQPSPSTGSGRGDARERARCSSRAGTDAGRSDRAVASRRGPGCRHASSVPQFRRRSRPPPPPARPTISAKGTCPVFAGQSPSSAHLFHHPFSAPSAARPAGVLVEAEPAQGAIDPLGLFGPGSRAGPDRAAPRSADSAWPQARRAGTGRGAALGGGAAPRHRLPRGDGPAGPRREVLASTPRAHR